MELNLADILSGRQRGAGAAALRAALAAAEIPYAVAVAMRNRLYDKGILKSRELPRPAVSVGNLTTGGSGKTPLVCWLAGRMTAAGRAPAVLMRGYMARDGKSDEQTLIAEAFPKMQVVANPDRCRGAASAIAADPKIDLFILDDAMQHRRVRREVEIVLIDATRPWGFGHLLPRGLLREPIGELRRAHAVVITRAGQIDASRLADIRQTVRDYNPQALLAVSDHQLTGLLAADGSAAPMSLLAETPYIAACGIARPESFVAALRNHGDRCVGQKFFADHHAFVDADVAAINMRAADTGAKAIVVTEKDWVKLAEVPAIRQSGIPFWRAQLMIQFSGNDGDRLVELVLARTAK